MNPKILVTGGSGLLGAYIIRWFKHQGYHHISGTYQHSLDRVPADIQEGVQWHKLSLPDQQAAIEVCTGQDWVVHAAGLVSYQQNDKYRLLDMNQTGTEHVVNACLSGGVSHLIYIGSIGALGKENSGVTLHDQSPWIENKFSTVYGMSKYLGELEVWRGAGEGLNASVILPSVILGTGDWNRSSLQLVDRVASKLPFYPGGQTGYVDVRDVSRFVGMLFERSITNERWILNASNLSYKEVYERLAHHLGMKKKFYLAPKWLAKAILMSMNLVKGKAPGIDILNHAYGTFSYDSSKSLKMVGFSYHEMERTLSDVAGEFLKGLANPILEFEDLK